MSKEIKHTPGKWEVEDPMGQEVGLAIVQAGLETYEWEFIALVCQSDSEDERVGKRRFISAQEQQANARLMAASPDLFEALNSAIITLEQVCEGQHEDNVCWHHLRAARAALAKARGE